MATQRLVLQCGSSTAAGLTQEKEAPRIRGNGSKHHHQHQQVRAPLGRFGFAVHEGLRMSSAPSSKSRRAMAARGTGSGQKGASLGIRCEKTVKLRLRLDHQVNFGETHALLGSAECTGAWQERVPMSWTESGWVAELQGKSGEQIEFKHMIITGDGSLVWENGPNRHITLPAEGAFEIVTHWDNTQESVSFHGELVHSGSQVEGEASPAQEHQNGGAVKAVEEREEGSAFSQGWQGREISFMQSNNHARERSERWDTTGLQGPALKIVEGDKRASNWWRKLEVVRELICSDLSKTERLEVLINAGVYLKWINTGAIACYEDGQHYRPNKHAEISRLIFRELEKINADTSTSYKEKLVIRKIHPCLPAFKAEFTASVPLTRIRDIAHRNDIPHDVKQEIKHTIQNKLHRNAGPEDLIATEAMLKRITKTPGQFSDAFVEQFKIFFKELKDFFNAGSLTEQLEGLRSSLDGQQISVLDNFLSSKQSLDSLGSSNGNAAKGTDSLIGTMHALTSLRAVLLQGLDGGLGNETSDEAIANRQKWRLSELGLEDYSFVLLSRLINAFESSGGASWLTQEAQSGNVARWNHALGAIVLGVRQLGLSGWQQGECHAIESELQAWQASGILEAEGVEEDKKMWALRLKATLDRARRMAETYSDTLLQLFPARVEKLGNAFGIPENTVRTYTEAEIRASVVFQLAKLCSLLLKAVRATAGGEGYDTLMPGKAVGTLVEVDRIIPGALPPSANGPVILLVKTADGDEEVKAAGGNVAGVILQHELPHLSHLGVRARQEGVVFVTCDDEDKVSEIKSLIGKTIALEASSESVRIAAHDGKIEEKIGKELVAAGAAVAQSVEKAIGAESTSGKKSSTTATLTKPPPAKQSTVAKSAPGEVIELAKASTETSGSKAAACGTLAVLSEKSAKQALTEGVSSAFEVPKGKVIPFGSMEDSLKASGSWKSFQALLEKVETAKLDGGELDKVCNELRQLVAKQRPLQSVISGLSKGGFPANARLIVRSSANVEDLAGMSGAGLYDSIPNVKLSEPENFGKAVAEVWASLYTRRAVLSRRVAGVPQKEACMSILVQELLSPELSFILHTISPIDHDDKVVQAEVAVGLGETLASGTRGSPWRLAANKFDGKVKTLAFANFSEKLVVNDDGKAADGTMVRQVVDYSTQRLSTHPEFRKQVGQRLASIGYFLEKSFGSAQDVEGCIVGTDIYIVQTRPQP